jgi:replicative DNA helicase
MKVEDFNLEAEHSVLGSMLIDARCIPDVTAFLRPEDFFGDKTRELYITICDMSSECAVIDHVTVMGRMRELGIYEGMTLTQAAETMNVSPERVRQLRNKAMRTIRDTKTARVILAHRNPYQHRTLASWKHTHTSAAEWALGL